MAKLFSLLLIAAYCDASVIDKRQFGLANLGAFLGEPSASM
jgi:hypothetical protein